MKKLNVSNYYANIIFKSFRYLIIKIKIESESKMKNKKD